MIPSQNSLLERTTTTIKKAVVEVLGIHRPRKKPWISDATLALTDERRKARKKANQDSSFRHEYKHLTRSIHKGLKTDKKVVQWKMSNTRDEHATEQEQGVF